MGFSVSFLPCSIIPLCLVLCYMQTLLPMTSHLLDGCWASEGCLLLKKCLPYAAPIITPFVNLLWAPEWCECLRGCDHSSVVHKEQQLMGWLKINPTVWLQLLEWCSGQCASLFEQMPPLPQCPPPPIKKTQLYLRCRGGESGIF